MLRQWSCWQGSPVPKTMGSSSRANSEMESIGSTTVKMSQCASLTLQREGICARSTARLTNREASLHTMTCLGFSSSIWTCRSRRRTPSFSRWSRVGLSILRGTKMNALIPFLHARFFLKCLKIGQDSSALVSSCGLFRKARTDTSSSHVHWCFAVAPPRLPFHGSDSGSQDSAASVVIFATGVGLDAQHSSQQCRSSKFWVS